MAGTLYGLGLSQQFDVNGRPLAGALLYVYASGTSTPATTYEDFALATARTFPIVADSAGRIPSFWVADGAYRARLTDAQGNEVFDLNGITAIGASSGTAGGSSVSATAIFNTGWPLWLPISGALSGWVRGNGQTIGSSASGATERANADTQPLYEYKWNNFSNALCPVTGGRGLSATADFNANKAIATLDMRDLVAIGLSGMGNTSTGLISDTAATAVGATTSTLVQANVPNYNLVVSSITGSVGTAITNGQSVDRGATTTAASGSAVNVPSQTNATLTLTDGTVTFGGSIPSGGSGTAFSNIPKGRVGSWYFKL